MQIKLLPHQAKFLQAPFKYKDISFFFLIGGYACGKTKSLCYALLHTVKELLGKKDVAGLNPKILVTSKNLTFMKKTLVGDFEQLLISTGSKYKYDKAHNIITIGNVELLLIPDEDEKTIYGFDVCLRSNASINIIDENGKALRKKIKDIKVGDKVVTTKGAKRVKRVICNGYKETIKLKFSNGSVVECTDDHRFIDVFDNNIEAKDLTNLDKVVILNNKELLKYQSKNGKNVEKLLKEKMQDEILQIKESLECAKSVEGSLKQANTRLLQLAHLTAKTSKGEKHEVWDIEVEDAHEFFANGVRVHNCCAYIDELDELPTETALAVVKSVNDRCRQRVEGFRSPFMMFATTSQGLKGCYQTVTHLKRQKMGFVHIRASTKDNIYLPQEYIKNIYSIYNEKERRCLLDGEFISIDSGLVFPDYDVARNKINEDIFDTVKAEETVYIGQDFNSFGNAGVACIVRDGVIHIIKDYDIPDIRRAAEVFRYDFPLSKIVWIPDATYKEHFSEFRKELRKNNILIGFRASNPLVQDRNFAINKALYTSRLMLHSIAKNVESAFLMHQKDPKTGHPMKGGKGSPDHWSDSLGYAVHYILCWNKEMKDLYKITLGEIAKRRNLEISDEEVDKKNLKV